MYDVLTRTVPLVGKPIVVLLSLNHRLLLNVRCIDENSTTCWETYSGSFVVESSFIVKCTMY